MVRVSWQLGVVRFSDHLLRRRMRAPRDTVQVSKQWWRTSHRSSCGVCRTDRVGVWRSTSVSTCDPSPAANAAASRPGTESSDAISLSWPTIGSTTTLAPSGTPRADAISRACDLRARVANPSVRSPPLFSTRWKSPHVVERSPPRRAPCTIDTTAMSSRCVVSSGIPELHATRLEVAGHGVPFLASTRTFSRYAIVSASSPPSSGFGSASRRPAS